MRVTVRLRIGVLYGGRMSAQRLNTRIVTTTDPSMFGHVFTTGNGGEGRYRWVLKRRADAADEPPTIIDTGIASNTTDAFAALYHAINLEGESVA